MIARTGAIATLVEWDADVPAWPVLKAEADLARAAMSKATMSSAATTRTASLDIRHVA